MHIIKNTSIYSKSMPRRPAGGDLEELLAEAARGLDLLVLNPASVKKCLIDTV